MSSESLAGYFSGAASIIVGNPLDLLKVRLQSSGGNGVVQPLQSFKTLAAGLPAPILTYGALNALLFTTYSRTLDALHRETLHRNVGDHGKPIRPLSSHFLAGAVGGFVTFIISAPTEYVKCRAQAPGRQSDTRNVPSKEPNPSSFSIAAQTVQNRGIRGLFLGGAITSVRDAIGYGFWFASYEASQALWDNQWTASHPPEAIKTICCGGLAGIATWTSIYPLDVVKTCIQTQLLPIAEQRGYGQIKGTGFFVRAIYAQQGVRGFWRGWLVCSLRAFVVNAVQWSAYEWAMIRLS